MQSSTTRGPETPPLSSRSTQASASRYRRLRTETEAYTRYRKPRLPNQLPVSRKSRSPIQPAPATETRKDLHQCLQRADPGAHNDAAPAASRRRLVAEGSRG